MLAEMRPRFLLLLACLPCLLLLNGCVGVNDVPASAAEVNFEGEQGHTGWARYEKTVILRNISLREALLAGEQALGFSKFTLRKSDPEHAMAIGEHGATPFDYNIIAGLYFRQKGRDVQVRIHVQASKDIGFLGDATERNWTSELESSLKAITNR